EKLAKLYLEKSFSRREAESILKEGFTEDRFKDLAAEADERELGVGKMTDERLMMYVGKKAIGNLGCYACHNIPGFQNAKPTGTALNDWGKKDPERLAFEDGHEFVKEHFNIAKLRDDPKDASKPASEWKFENGKPPFEKFFEQMLDHHHQTREGFLHL